ncbi:MAG: S-adenosyl-l-methionine hydroxide adenosyltransferase family protein [Candidatus Thorarchaeota archaeon]
MNKIENIIALLTDFGTRGQHYVAAMKAVILNISPRASIIDITHEITPYSIVEASYILKTTYKHFPKGTVFIIVVDPGVGSTRRLIALKIKSDYYFIGPDNGIFPNVFDTEEVTHCHSIQNEDYFKRPVSPTFHGRDIMAPIGASIAKYKNFPLSDLGPKFGFRNLVKKPITLHVDLENRIIEGIIQYVDTFGNGTTTIPMIGNKIKNSDLKLENDLRISILINDKMYEGIFTSHFSNVPEDSILFLVGSTGFLEVSINQGNAAKILNFKVGDKVTLQI